MKYSLHQAMAFSNIQEVFTYLDSIPKFQNSGKSAANFNLSRFRKFCQAMGDPQKDYPCIHVGGTNGKGSTCQILSSVYRQSGYKVGMYTSPHIMDYRERFKIDGQEIPDALLVRFFQDNESLIKSFKLTYFELSTAVAFWYFNIAEVDLAIIEVGLGGRLDATNIIVPLVSVITSISLDHTDILGDTIEKIAREKAGIIKDGVPVVLGNIGGDANNVIERVAASKSSPVTSIQALQPEFRDHKYYLHADGEILTMESGMNTPVQANNIAAAWQVTRLLNQAFPVERAQFIKGIEQVRNIFPSLGRFEKLHDDYEWYFDGAHNLEAVLAMKEVIDTMKPCDEAILVFSMMHDKVGKQILNEFSVFNKIFYHELNTPRAAALEYIQQYLPDVYAFPVSDERQKLLFEEFETELVIFAGSFYFYTTVRDWIATFTENR